MNKKRKVLIVTRPALQEILKDFFRLKASDTRH